MKPSIIYLPKKGHPPRHVGTFAWQLSDDGPEIQAIRTAFGLVEFPNGSGVRHWLISGTTGSVEEENYSNFQINLEYQRGPIENKTFKLGDDEKMLAMAYTFSIPGTEEFYAFQTSYPDSGEVTLSLDLQAGTVEGHFKNIYKKLRQTPKGHFRLTRDDQ